MRYFSGIVALIVVLGVGSAFAQKLVRSTPANKATGVPVDIGELNFHFDQDMLTDSWSFLPVKWAKYPPLQDRAASPWVNPRHCCLKIGKLEPETIYVVKLNSGREMGFRGKTTRMPLSSTVIMFTTGKAEAGGGAGPVVVNPLGGGGGEQPAKDKSLGGGGKSPESANPLGAGAKLPDPANPLGAGGKSPDPVNPLEAGGNPPPVGRTVLLRAAAPAGLVVARQFAISQRSRTTKRAVDAPAGTAPLHQGERAQTSHVFCHDKYAKVEDGLPRLIQRTVVYGSAAIRDPNSGETADRKFRSPGKTFEVELDRAGVVRVTELGDAGEPGGSEAVGKEVKSLPMLHLLPGREVMVGEEWKVPSESLRRAFSVPAADRITVRGRLVRVSLDPGLGCEVARIEGRMESNYAAGGGLRGAFTVDFAPALGIVVRQSVGCEVRLTKQTGSGPEAQVAEVEMSSRVVETIRVLTMPAKAGVGNASPGVERE